MLFLFDFVAFFLTEIESNDGGLVALKGVVAFFAVAVVNILKVELTSIVVVVLPK